ncbi:cytochrome c oxidase assembly protein [Oricola thermophila]|nr:cytochrome c oxidase assembly protein [Oricola thermophila]
MTNAMQDNTSANRRSNVVIAVACVGFFAGMVGMAYASVPLYRLFCQVTGYGGTTQVADAPTGVVLDRDITVRFDANTSGIGWEFRPLQRSVTIPIGETTQIAYMARNMTSQTVTGTATFNVTPQAAGAYFNKMECFCFTEQTLAPGEEMEMPVVFFVDPDIVDSEELEGISAITLSYTFFPVDEPKPVAQTVTDADVTQTIQ